MSELAKKLKYATAAIALATATSAWAQDSGQATGQDAEAGSQQSEGLKLIVVTATRTGETDLQSTPVAVTSISGDELLLSNSQNLQDVANFVPSLSIGNRPGFGSGQGSIALRGMGVEAQESAQAVGTYIDDVFYASQFGNILGLMDVERVEVLRGPQGTLFGRNTIAGAIQYVTKAPSDDFNGYVRGTFGNFGRKDAAAAINIPLGDTLAVRVAGQYNTIDGFVYDRLNDTENGAMDTIGARMRVRWTPTDRLTVDLKGEYAQLKTNGRPVFLRRFDNNAQFVGLANAFRELFGPPGLPPYGFTNADITPSFTPGDQEISGFGDPDFSDIDTTVLQATIAYDLTDDLTVKSITSFTKTNSLIQVDFDATPVDFLSVGYTEDNEAFTQELQVFGSAADGRLNYTLGGFYFKNDFSRIQALEIGFLPPDTSGGNQVYDVESFAVYGQLSYDLTDQLTAAVGLRYTDESINAGLSGAFLAPPGQPIIPQTFPESNVSFSDWSPYFGINFQASDDVFLFAKASKGFRAGGFTINKLFLTDAQAGNQLATPFRPETAWTYELGARIEAFDGRLRFNPTIFQTNWDSLQFLQPGSNVPNIFTNNAGDARIRGLELETQFAVTDQLVLSGSFSYLDARYTRLDQNLRTLFPDGFVTNTNGLGPIPSFFAGGPPVVPNVTGPRMGAPVVRNYVDINTPLPRAPEFKYTIGARYTVPLNSGAEVVINADYAWTDKQTTTAESIAQFVPSYGLLNGRVQYTSADGMWSVGVFGNNLTNDFYINNETSYDLGLTVGPRLVDPGRGRSYGIEFGFNF